MRSLRIVVRSTRGALPLLVAAGIAPSAACGAGEKAGSTTPPGASVGGSGGAGGLSAAGGGETTLTSSTGISTTGIGGAIVGAGGIGGSSVDAGAHCGAGVEDTYTVPLPPEGVPADPGQICSAIVQPVESNRAARVTLVADPANLQLASGFVEIGPDLLSRVVGSPVVEVIDATVSNLEQMQVTMVALQSNGYSFQASWPTPIRVYDFARMTVRTTLELRCTPEPVTRVVHAVTDVHLCLSDQDFTTPEWVSAGDRCTVCRIIAEMAPSPIIPDKKADGLPLARALRLRLVELVRVANAVVLLAENDGGSDVQYEWHPSAGRIEKLAPDVVLWTLEEGMDAPFIQAAALGPDAAAVASWAFNEAP